MKSVFIKKVCPVCNKVHEGTHEQQVRDNIMDIELREWEHTVYHIVCEDCRKYKEAFELCPTCNRPEGYKSGLFGRSVQRTVDCRSCRDSNKESELLKTLLDCEDKLMLSNIDFSYDLKVKYRNAFEELKRVIKDDICSFNLGREFVQIEFDKAVSYRESKEEKEMKETSLFGKDCTTSKPLAVEAMSEVELKNKINNGMNFVFEGYTFDEYTAINGGELSTGDSIIFVGTYLDDLGIITCGGTIAILKVSEIVNFSKYAPMISLAVSRTLTVDELKSMLADGSAYIEQNTRKLLNLFD